jgi:hypothetical protein
LPAAFIANRTPRGARLHSLRAGVFVRPGKAVARRKKIVRRVDLRGRRFPQVFGEGRNHSQSI